MKGKKSLMNKKQEKFNSKRVKTVIFSEEMKKTHTVLIPDMLPIHFNLILSVFSQYGYKCELLRSTSKNVVDEGLKNVHNDTCYPALLVIGQFMEALKSGKYDVDKTALLITQTGGGCRASNYIKILRKALSNTFPQVPVMSLNFSGLEKEASLPMTPMMTLKLIFAVLYGDMLMLLNNQCLPYELEKGKTAKMVYKWERILRQRIRKNKFFALEKTYLQILNDFAKIERSKIKKPKVGIVGEIYVKHSPLANNRLEEFLIQEGCEPVVPGLLDFIMYCAVNSVVNSKLYSFKDMKTRAYNIGYKVLYSKQKQMINIIKEHGVFNAPHDFEFLRKQADKYCNQGVQMGEGWLIPAEMATMVQTGTENIVTTQPFGCLPNHIVAKGMVRAIKNDFDNANIVAIDYDPGATKVNQENRIKLMLANINRK